MKYNDLNYVDSKEKIKNRREETKIDSEIEEKNGENDFWGLVICFGRVFR